MAKILLVEDDEMNRDMLSRRLTRKGHQVIIATDGKQGISMAHLETPELILNGHEPSCDGWLVLDAEPRRRSQG